MSQPIVTVAYAAERLKLHPKTVLRFIRDGRLKATRIGKSYRILKGDLEAFAGAPAEASLEARVTSIVDIAGVGPELAQKLARQVTAALQSRSGDGSPVRADVVHDPGQSSLKIVLVGEPRDAGRMLELIQVWLAQP